MKDRACRLNINTLLKSLIWLFTGVIIGIIIGYAIFTATLSQPVSEPAKSIESHQTTESK